LGEISSQPGAVSFPTETGDDLRFLDLVRLLIAAELRSLAVRELFVIRIDNWIDEKWLGFSGLGRVEFPWAVPWQDTALDEFRDLTHATFPPFTPARVLAERHFVQEESGGYGSAQEVRLVHDRRRQQSANNLQHRIGDFSASALFVWFSSNSEPSGRGSLMVYRSTDGSVTSWYASFDGNHDWRPSRVKGIALGQLKAWIQARNSS
jgi:hypothetical protein